MNFVKVFSRNNDAFECKEVLKLLPDAVFVLSGDGSIVWGNEKAVSMFDNGEKPLTECHFDEIVADGMVIAENACKEGKSIATGAFACSGKEVFVEISAAKNEDEYYVTARDITTLTGLLELAEDTGKLNKEKNYMLCKLSGDIKSPLQSISGFSQALLDGLGGELNEKQDKYIKIINKNSGELSYFLDKLLEFSWAQSTLLNVDCKNFDVVNSLQNILKPAGIVLDYEELNKKNIYSDENLIKIIVQNLIDCSAKIADTGAITVKIMELKDESESDTVKITVTNKGIGLSDAEKADLFDPYSQLEKPGRKGVLRSLSLASIEILVKKLGGDVWIESGIMQGTAFNVILPGNVGSEQLAVSS